MPKKTEKISNFIPDTLFQVKEMGKRIKFILKQENLYQNREDSYGYTCGKILEEDPVFSLKFNDSSKASYIYVLLTQKYNYNTKIDASGYELHVKHKHILDISDIAIDGEIEKEIKDSFEQFDSDPDNDPKLEILRSRYKKIIGAIRYHFPMGYGFNQNSSNGYKSTRIKSAEDDSFFMQFTTSELTDSISHFLFKNGHKAIKQDSNTLQIFVTDIPEESEILKNIIENEFTSDQLNKIWDILNTNGLVLLDVNNQFSVLDLFNGKGLPQINKEHFVKIIKNQ
jgi:hypothetical protein